MNQIKLIAACFLLAVCSCKDNVADKPASVTTTTTATTEDSSVTTAPPQNKPDIAVAAQAIKAELQKRSVKSQVFSSDSCHGLIIGKAGTLISVDKAALETMDGKPVTGDVVVELKELIDKSAFMSADAQLFQMAAYWCRVGLILLVCKAMDRT